MTLDVKTPVLLLGGKENALSVTRHLGRLGVPVRASGPRNCWALHSRFCAEALPVPNSMKQQEYWESLLLGNDGRLNGHIIWAMSDDAIEFLNRNRPRLAARYVLDDCDTDLQRQFLDKMKTLELARQAGVAAPQHWKVQNEADLAALRGQIKFPAVVKPIQSHAFTKVFGKKLFIVEDSFDELAALVRKAWAHRLDIFIAEMVPGPDSLLSSYYTYRTQDGSHLFDFTKSVIRRWPVNRGNACYHKTGWLPETAEAGAKFFDSVGLRGLGNIEFKRDTRDGKLKVIEVNARFTAAQELVRRSGIPIDLIIYCRLTKQPLPAFTRSDKELRMWYPLRDFLGFAELWRRGELSLLGWIKSVATTCHVFPLFSLSDPLPVVGAVVALAQRLVVP
jgi:D-aspartate ligase